VEPVDGAAFARFLGRWQGIGGSARGADRLREVLLQLEGLSLPASVLERDLLPARVSDYQPRLLDELGAAGEVAWVGRGRLGKDDGRIALARRQQLPALGAAAQGEDSDSPLHSAILDALRSGGASFFTDLVVAARTTPRDVLDALWDLVWAGLVTNDTFAPVRALAWPKRHGPPPRGRAGGLPPESAGRWSLVPATPEATAATATARAHELANTLLERYGVVTREAVAAEGIAGGFSAVYPVLKAMEEGGRIRRGYFVEGLGAAQFALPGAVDRLRAEREARDEPEALVLAATDPANPYGAALPWPRHDDQQRRGLQRAAGAYVVLVDGAAALYLERGGRSVVTLPAFGEERGSVTLAALTELASGPGSRGLTLERIDGVPAAESPFAGQFREAGFVSGYRGLTFRTTREVVPGARGR
jgi:ATP-dependent Lhr-like helicase